MVHGLQIHLASIREHIQFTFPVHYTYLPVSTGTLMSWGQ